MEKILLATDGSENALRAARLAGELSYQFDIPVVAVYVLLPVPALQKAAVENGGVLTGAGSMAALRGTEKAAEDILRKSVQVLEQAGARYTARWERGLPAQVLCEIAEAQGCDLIVIGRHGMEQASKRSLGSVSEHVARCAHLSVILVK